MVKLFLSLAGRMSRIDFWAGLVGFALFVMAAQYGLDLISTTMIGFFLSLVFLVLFFRILYAIYGKRLHDFGHTVWPLTAMLALTVLIAMGVLMAFGGAEYFSEFAQYDRKADIDPAEIERLQNAYQARLSEGGRVLGPLLWGLWGLFTLWVGLSKADLKENRYGHMLTILGTKNAKKP